MDETWVFLGCLLAVTTKNIMLEPLVPIEVHNLTKIVVFMAPQDQKKKFDMTFI